MIENVRIGNHLLHLSLTVKFYHWTVRGNDAFPLHEQLDQLHDDLIALADRIFEDAFANDDDIFFDVGLNEDGVLFTTDQIVKQLISALTIMIGKTEKEGADQGRRGTGNILDDVAESLTNWVYLLKLYQSPENS